MANTACESRRSTRMNKSHITMFRKIAAILTVLCGRPQSITQKRQRILQKPRRLLGGRACNDAGGNLGEPGWASQECGELEPCRGGTPTDCKLVIAPGGQPPDPH
mmetsp:Transcript_15571/g.27735  ORF Transcript_15571/g.27735 Transcript_15571/m.27735 type:complete len:105 (+) Transcript_15571:966-1280(+)